MAMSIEDFSGNYDNLTKKSTDSKGILVASFCMITVSGVMSYFFGVYWLNNPDAVMPNNSEVYCWASNTALAAG